MYANVEPNINAIANSDFGVLLGISVDTLDSLPLCNVSSVYPEVGIISHIPTEYIKIIVAPTNKENFVKKLVGDRPIEVITMNIKDPFYKMTMSEKKQKLDKDIEIKKKEKIAECDKYGIERLWEDKSIEYGQEDVKKLAKGRRLSKLLGWLTKSKEKNRGNEDESIIK